MSANKYKSRSKGAKVREIKKEKYSETMLGGNETKCFKFDKCQFGVNEGAKEKVSNATRIFIDRSVCVLPNRLHSRRNGSSCLENYLNYLCPKCGK